MTRVSLTYEDDISTALAVSQTAQMCQEEAGEAAEHAAEQREGYRWRYTGVSQVGQKVAHRWDRRVLTC